jgi:hypothetical protein
MPVDEFEKVGLRAVKLKPASGIGALPLLALRDKS